MIYDSKREKKRERKEKRMLYNTKKKTQHLLALKKHVNQPYIGVIETTMMYHSLDQPNDHFISVSKIVEEGIEIFFCINQKFKPYLVFYGVMCALNIKQTDGYWLFYL